MKKFILTIKQHRQLGVLIAPFVIVMPDQLQEYFEVDTFVNLDNIDSLDIDLSDDQKKIITLSDSFSDEKLPKLFSKKHKGRDFFKNLDAEFIEQRIRPFIEKKIYESILLAEKSNTPVFFKENIYQRVYRSDSLIIEELPAKTIFNFEKKEDHSRYYLTINHNNVEMKLTHTSAEIITQNPCLLALNNKIYKFNDIDGKKLIPFFKREFVQIPQSTERKYFDSFVKNSIKNYEVKATGFCIEIDKNIPKTLISIEKNLMGNEILHLKFQYSQKTFSHNSTLKVSVNSVNATNSFHFIKTIRNVEFEQKIINKLKEQGLKIDSDGFLSTQNEKSVVEWININHNFLEENNIIIEKQKIEIDYFTDNIDLKIDVKQENDWFDVYGYAIFGVFKIPFNLLKKNILNNKKEFKLPNGEIAILPLEWFDKFQNLFLIGKTNEKGIRLKSHHHALLGETIIGIDDQYAAKLKEQYQSPAPEYTLPKKLKAKLRPYQYEGFKWLNHLRNNKLGACLADDMGLGKTLQALTLLCKVEEEKANVIQSESNQPIQTDLFEQKQPKAQKRPSLIVMPASLIHNWYNEIEKFAPHLTKIVYTGTDRSTKVEEFQSTDIILTTYGTARNDIEILRDYLFHYLILDESQFIKNTASKSYKALNLIDAIHFLTLTGTPIENSLTDLWTQMNFANHGILGNLNFFKLNYVIPIEKQKDEVLLQKLQAIISPFILRRKKQDVATDLPPVTEQIIYCEMLDEQKKLYDSEKSKYRNYIFEKATKKSKYKDKLLVLQSLNKLRQIANHPKMVDSYYTEESGKMEAITEALENVITERHKVLIFSSYVKHLNLIEEYIIGKNIPYSKLTGDIPQTKREEVVRKFQEEETSVFLISIKAGGVGLNLTAADYVFIIDPWWNPAAEQQAIDRSHRIGQQKNVMVYRFISKETIEEKIMLLQSRKKQLASAIDETGGIGILTDNEIDDLFS